jgi:hypothetical protein
MIIQLAFRGTGKMYIISQATVKRKKESCFTNTRDKIGSGLKDYFSDI